MKPIQAALAACLALAGTARADGYGNFIVFGDSLSDAGTFQPIAAPGGGRFTTNPGPVWSENVASALGATPAPAQLWNGAAFVANPGGDNWAQGGARVTGAPGVQMLMAQPVSTQVTTYLTAQGSASGSALYGIWAGANDIFFQAASGLPAATVQANVATAATELAGQVARLQAAGARNIMVINLPDMGRSPSALASGPASAAALTGLSQLYNFTLDSALTSAGVQGLRLDAYRLFDEILADPDAFGFAVGNAAVACQPQPMLSLHCTAANFATPSAASTYMFADGVHPTTAGHRIVSDYALSVLRAPALAARAADQLARAADGQWLGSDTRQRRFLDGLQAEGGDFWVSGQAAYGRFEAEGEQPELRGRPAALTVGMDRNFGGGWFGGVALAYLADRFEAAGEGKGSGSGLAMNAYGSKRFGGAYVSGAASLASLGYDLKRDFALGIASRREEASSSGTVKGLRLEAGYDLGQGTLRHGPLAAATWRRVEFQGYAENSGRSTAVRYGEQEFDLFRSSLGYQASWQAGGNLRLSARLTREHEQRDSRRDLSFGLASNGGRMTVPVGRGGGAYSQLSLGADWRLTPASALVATVNAAGSQDGARQEALLLSYSSRF